MTKVCTCVVPQNASGTGECHQCGGIPGTKPPPEDKEGPTGEESSPVGPSIEPPVFPVVVPSPTGDSPPSDGETAGPSDPGSRPEGKTPMTFPNNDALATMDRNALTKLYNEGATEKGAKVVKTFRDKATALARVIALRDGTKAPKGSRSKPKGGTGRKAKANGNGTRKTGGGGGKGRAHKPFDLPALKEVKEARKESKRAKLVEMLGSREGISVEEAMKEFSWDRRTALEGIRLVHDLLGFGLKESAEGRIHLVRS